MKVTTRYPQEGFAIQLEARFRSAFGHLPTVRTSYQLMGVNSCCEASNETSYCSVACFDGPEYLIHFQSTTTPVDSWGRSDDASEIVAAVGAWLEHGDLESLRLDFGFVDRKERKLRTLIEKVVARVAEVHPEDCNLKRSYGDLVDLRIAKGDRSCKVHHYGDEPFLRFEFLWDECPQCTYVEGEDDVFVDLLRSWLIERSGASELAIENSQVQLKAVAKFYEEGRPIEGEFLVSWQKVREFFKDELVGRLPLTLMDQLQSQGYQRRLRAGQSMFTLIFSRSRWHGLREGQPNIRFDFRERHFTLTATLGEDTPKVIEEQELTPEVMKWVEELANLPIT